MLRMFEVQGEERKINHLWLSLPWQIIPNKHQHRDPNPALLLGTENSQRCPEQTVWRTVSNLLHPASHQDVPCVAKKRTQEQEEELWHFDFMKICGRKEWETSKTQCLRCFFYLKLTPGWDCWGAWQGQDLLWRMFVCPFQFRIFHNSISTNIWCLRLPKYWENQDMSGKYLLYVAEGMRCSSKCIS